MTDSIKYWRFRGQKLRNDTDFRDTYDREGAVRATVLSSAEVAQLSSDLQELEREVDQGVAPWPDAIELADEISIRQCYDIPRRGRSLTELATWHKTLFGLLRLLLDDEPIVSAGLMLDKSVTANWSVDWHQDTSVYCSKVPNGVAGEVRGGLLSFRPEDGTMGQQVVVRIAIDHDVLGAGCIEYIPESQCLGNLKNSLPTCLRRSRVRVADLYPREILFFNPLLIHRAGLNKTNSRRRVIQLTFRPAGLKLSGDAEWIDWQEVRGASAVSKRA